MTTVADTFRSLSDCPATRAAVVLTDYINAGNVEDWSRAFNTALDECAIAGKPLLIPPGLYPVQYPIVLNKSHWGLCVFGPGAVIQPTEKFDGYGVFEFRNFTPDMTKPGGRMSFYDFAIVGVPKKKLSEQKGVGFATIGVYPESIPAGTLWHNIRCENLFYGWDLSGAWTFLLNHVSAYRCAQGFHAEGHIGSTRINSSELRRNGYGIYVKDADISTFSLHNTVVEANSGYGIHIIGNYGVVDIRCCHFENNKIGHIAGDGGLDLSVECCQFAECLDQHVRLSEIPTAQTMNTSFRMNRYWPERPAIVLNSSMTQGWHVFDAKPVFHKNVSSRPVFAHPDGLRYWEAGPDGEYRLIVDARAP